MKITIIALCLSIFVGQFSMAETKSEMREKLKKLDSRMQQSAGLLKAGVITPRTLGFAETSSLDSNPASFPETFHTQLTLRFSCAQKDLNNPIIPKFKNVKWKILDRELKLSGNSQTDSEGCLVIGVTTAKNIAAKKIKISIGSLNKVMEIGMGRPEIFLSEDDCLSSAH
jgi:hypothetical protein